MEATTTYLTSISVTSPPQRKQTVSQHIPYSQKDDSSVSIAVRYISRRVVQHGEDCTYCKIFNHTAEVCRKTARDKKTNKLTGKNTNSGGNETANVLTPTTLDNRPTETKEAKRDHFAYALNEENNKKEWKIVLKVKGSGFKAKMDTRALCNVMPIAAYQVLCNEPP